MEKKKKVLVSSPPSPLPACHVAYSLLGPGLEKPPPPCLSHPPPPPPQEDDMLATQQKQEQQRTKREAVTELASMRDEPRALMQKAVDIVKQYTSAGAAYAANVAEQEEPDWVPPEDDEAAQAESDDEAEPTPPTDLPEGEEEAAALAEPPAEVPVEGDPPAEDGTPAPPRPIDYSKKYLSYIVATAGQEFVPSTELIRPPPPQRTTPKPRWTFQPTPSGSWTRRCPWCLCPTWRTSRASSSSASFPRLAATKHAACRCPAGSSRP